MNNEDKEYNTINFMTDVSAIYSKFPNPTLMNVQANQMAGEWQSLSMKYVYKMQSKIDNLQSQLDIANKKLDEIKEKIEDYSCIYNKGFPHDLLIAVKGICFNENQYIELDKVLEDFKSIIGGE